MMKVHAGNSRINGAALIYFFKLFVVLFGIWILLSGKFEVKFLAAGLLTALGTAYLFLPLLTVENKRTGEPIYLLKGSLWQILGYGMWLVWEIMKSSLSATALVLRGRLDYTPRVVYFAMDFENPVATALLANSITLTPGTITLSVSEDGVFAVHAMAEACAAQLLNGEMQQKVARLYGESCSFVPLPERTLIARAENGAQSLLKQARPKGGTAHG